MMPFLRDRTSERWLAGQIDDRAFEKAQTARARNLALLIVGMFIAFAGIGLAVSGMHNRHELTPVLLMLGLIAVIGIVFAFHMGKVAKVMARNMILRRNKQIEEARAFKASAESQSASSQNEQLQF
jgi:hypothetical protein